MSAIVRAYRFAKSFQPVVQRLNKIGQRSDPTNMFIDRYFPPHLRLPAKRWNRYAQIAISGGLIYDIIHDNWNAISPKQRQAPNRLQQKYSKQPSDRSGQYKYRSGSSYYRRQRNSRYCKPSRKRMYY